MRLEAAKMAAEGLGFLGYLMGLGFRVCFWDVVGSQNRGTPI